MLCFTSNRAGVAADAVAIIDNESKIQKCLLRKCTLCNNAFDKKFYVFDINDSYHNMMKSKKCYVFVFE